MTAAQTFTATGAVQTVTVPTDASVAIIECWGAQGSPYGTGTGGKGGYAKGTLAVTPGETLVVCVGTAGNYSAGGWNGGGGVAAYGGGASDVRQGGTALQNRVIVAGGGGGASEYMDTTNTSNYFYVNGRDGGGLAAADPSDGSQTAGGVGRTGSAFWTPGGSGSLGQGGAGAYTLAGYHVYCGGGGGGLYGGAGGSAGSDATSDAATGGGGGSSFVGGLANTATSVGVQSGDGQVVITWVNTAPSAPTLLTPPNNASAVTPPQITWQSNDPDVGDYQTSADVQFRKSGDSTWTTVTGAATTAGSYQFTSAQVTAGSQYEWQVRTYDKTGTVGPWSGSFFFNAVTTPPAPTITAPTDGATVYDTPLTVTLTVPAGQTATAYQVQRTDGGTTVYFDSGSQPPGGVTVPLDAVYGRVDHIKARYLAGVWSDWADISVTVDVGPPQAPTVALVPLPDDAAVLVQITNPAQAPGYAAAVSNDVLRTGPDGVTVRLATGLAVGASFTDWLPGAGVNDYRAVAYAANGATSEST